MTIARQAELIQELLNTLFEAESRRLDKIILSLCDRNTALKGKTCYGFTYQGERYIPKCHLNKLGMLRVLPSLHFELNREVMTFVSDANKVKQDQVHVKQLLTLLLTQCANIQEVRDSIPDCLANLTPIFRGMPRKIQNPDYLIRNNPHFMVEYERTLPKIQFYATTHLLY